MTRPEYARGLEAAAAIADMFVVENMNMACDAVMLAPASLDPSRAELIQVADALDLGMRHSGLAHIAALIAQAIRAAKETP